MKNNFKIFITATLTVASILTGCKKTLDIQPTDQIDAATALSTKSGIEATVISIYSTLKGQNLYGNALVGLGEALADNGISTNRSGRYVNEAANVKGAHYAHWSNSYSAINRINLVLQAVPNVSDASFTTAQRDAYTGELEFLRALYYFDLVKAYAYIPGFDVPTQNFGGVPLILTPIQTINDALTISTPRAPIAAIYTQIYADLDDAIVKIPTTTTLIARATRLGAEALYSRVALYNKDYAKVIAMSSDVITKSTTHVLLNSGNYVAGFRSQFNPESLFEVAYTISSESLGVNVSLQTLFTTLVAPGNRSTQGGFGDLVPSADLINALGITMAPLSTGSSSNGSASAAIASRSTDVRNLLFELGSKSPYYIECTKFLGRSGSINLDNVPVIRIAEMYLNRAEAYANLSSPDPASALADVNTIRTNRGLSAIVTGTLSGSPLINEIALQRRLEFAFEGQRFLDLKRRGLDIIKPSGVTFAFTNPLLLPAIPQTDVDASLGILKQNFSY